MANSRKFVFVAGVSVAALAALVFGAYRASAQGSRVEAEEGPPEAE